ncbi:MAG: DNA modification methylase [bacterium]
MSDATISPQCPVLVIPQQDLERDVPLYDIIVPSNLKRSIDTDKVSGLKRSMENTGLIAPIVVTQDHVLVAGNHRLMAARELGWITIRAKIVPTDPQQNELIAIDENLMRNNLSVLEESEHILRREEIILERQNRALSGENQFTTGSGVYVAGDITESGGLYCRPPQSTTGKLTTKDLADDVGLAKSTYQERVKIGRDMPECVKNLIRETPISDNKSDLLRLIKVKDPVDQMKIAQYVVNGVVNTVKESVSLVEREKQRDDYLMRGSKFDILPKTSQIHHGDFFLLGDQIADNSVDAVITDPPYVSDWSEHIMPFLSITNRILKPSGFAVFYIGHLRLPEVFEGLRECQRLFKDDALNFYWIASLYHTGSIKMVQSHGIECQQKPVIILQKPPHKLPFNHFTDVIQGSGREKDLHDWQQGESELETIFSSFTQPGDLICDPFMGSCTVGVVAQRLQRQFIGYDTVEENVKIATVRLSQDNIKSSELMKEKLDKVLVKRVRGELP